MLRHYLAIALRTLRRERGYAAINVLGLGLGIAAALLLTLYVHHELSFDRFHEHEDRLHRVWLEEYYEGEELLSSATPLPLADQLEGDFPEVEHTARVYAFTDLVRRGETQFAERMHLAGPAFFEMFSFPLLRGDPATALADPHSVVLTTTMAAKYFGAQDPLGQQLDLQVGGELRAFTVTGVAADPPAASSIQFGFLVPFDRSLGVFREGSWDAWQQVYGETYVLLRPGVSRAAFEDKLGALVQRVRPDLYAEGLYTFHSQPIADIHLNTSVPAGIEPTGNPAYPVVLGGIAALILVIACVNFVTLAVSRSVRRAREVGVRKAIGAGRRELMGQFWGEAAAVTAAAMAVGLILSVLLLPAFNRLAGTALTIPFEPTALLFILGLGVVIAAVAGSYPAVVLAGFRPVDALRDRVGIGGDRSLLRRGLVVLQFAMATVLVAGTLLMARQLDFLSSKPLGFDREQVVMLPTTGGYSDGLEVAERLRAALLREPGFVNVAPAAFGFHERWAEFGYDADDGTYREFDANLTGHGFIETMGIEMAAGHAFRRDVPADAARGLVVNTAFARAYGWTPEEALGQRLPGRDFPDHEIIGVTEDFHYASLHSAVGPVALVVEPSLILRGAANVMVHGEAAVDIAVRMAPGDLAETMGRLEAVWAEVAPEQPFAFTFLDDALDAQYRQEARLSSILTAAAGLAIVIACLGLFGLAALTAARRTREVGVRKVLGASVPSLVALLSRDFAALVLVGFALAVPAVYLGGTAWLDGFAYRVALGPGIFVVAGMLALGVALLTVSVHAFRAATADPVRALRSE